MLKMIKKYYVDINNEMRQRVPKVLDEIFIAPLYHKEAVNLVRNTLGSGVNLTRNRDHMPSKACLTKIFDKLYFIRSFEMYEL